MTDFYLRSVHQPAAYFIPLLLTLCMNEEHIHIVIR